MKQLSRDFVTPRAFSAVRLALMGVLALLVMLFASGSTAWATGAGTGIAPVGNGAIVDSSSNTVSPTSDTTYALADSGTYTISGTFLNGITLTGGTKDSAVTVTLSDSTSFTSGSLTIGSNAYIILDLNGYTLTGSGSASVIIVSNGATLIIQDSSATNVGGVTTGGTGKIDGNSSGSGASVSTVSSGGALTLEGGTITGGTGTGTTSTNGGGVHVTGNTFTMTGGTISGNSATDSGGGVYVESGSFTMTGGTISGNSATGGDTANTGNGGGVYVASGTFTMSGTAAISGNNATGTENSSGNGGGVYVGSGGKFEMSGGTISGNSATNVPCFLVAGHGGGVYVAGGTFTMGDATDTTTNPTISSNTANSNGGGVYVTTGTFTMKSGTIGGTGAGNQANSGGGVYINGTNATNATFTMGTSDATTTPNISNNTASVNGGGVYMGGGTVNMYSGSIQSNKAINGGGVYLASGTFNMGVAPDATNTTNTTDATTPTISSNTASGDGGGVHVVGEAFNMNSGTINGNTAIRGGGIYAGSGGVVLGNGANSTTAITYNTATLYGGGMYLYSATLTLDGTVKIIENTIAGTNSNLYLGHTIVSEIDGRVQFASTFDTSGSQIGVAQASTGVGFTCKANVTFTDSMPTDETCVFFSDLSNYTLSTTTDTYITGDDDTTIYTEYTLILKGSAASLFGGGNGTAQSPYLISTLTHLNNLSAYVGSDDVNGKYFQQTANITITGTYAPIGGSNSTAFTGTYDGGGYTISGSISNASTTNQGIFGQIGTGGTVQNLTAAVSVTGLEYVGGIAGVNRGTITSCYNKGTITGSVSCTGGIAGANYGTIQYCYNAGTIRGDASTGGIAGASSGDALNGSGFTYIGAILHCYNLGTISATGNDVGGIVGNADAKSTTQYCYNIGAYSGVETNESSELNVGSIAGLASLSATIQYCYYLSDALDSTTLIGFANGLNVDTGEREPTWNNFTDKWEGAITDNTALTLAQMTADAAKTNMPYLFNAKKADGSTIWFTHYNGTPGFVLVTEPVPEPTPEAAPEFTPAVVVANWYTVTLSSNGGGVVAPELSGFETIKMKEGSSYTFNITPNAGYAISAVYVDGTNIGAVDAYTVEEINSDRSIKAVFVRAGTDDAEVVDDAAEDAAGSENDATAEDTAGSANDATADGTAGDADENADDTAGDATEQADDATADEANGKGGVAYIVMGVLVAIAALGGVGFWLFKRKPGLGEDGC